MQNFKHLIVVQINAVESEAAALYFPNHNVVGSLLLSELLKSALQAAAIEGHAFMDGQGLNDAAFVIAANGELRSALELVKDVLKRASLLNWAQIDWLTPDEILRPYYPECASLDLNVLVANPSAMAAKLTAVRRRAASARTLEAQELLAALLKCRQGGAQ